MLSSNKTLYTFAFLEGATVLAIELLSARMLIPYFGTGVQVWGTIIGITVLSLALGYFLGGYLSENEINKHKLFFIFLLASALMTLMPIEAKSLMATLVNLDPFASLIITCIILLVPCLSLFGATPVIIIHLLSKSHLDAGKTAGNIYAISTLGGILSTLVVGFYLIPEFGITVPTFGLALIPGGFSFILLLMAGKMIAMPYVLFVLLGFLSTKNRTPNSNIKVLYESEGLLGQVMVVDAVLPGQSDRILFVNRMGQTFVDLNTGESRWSYVKYSTSICSTYPPKSKALLLGLGGGSLARNLTSQLGFNLTTVELDERMAGLGKRFFGLPENITHILDDARHFLHVTNETYDIIIIDIFKGEVPPAHLFTKECFEQIKTRLSDKGMLLINFNGFLKGSKGKAARSLYKTLLAAEINVKVLPTFESPKYRNCIFICKTSEIELKKPRIPLIQNWMEINIASSCLPKEALYFPDAAIYTDDMPRLEHYNIDAAKAWRDEYKKTYTNLMTSKGISLFK
ncbi:MAG TPA: hypothetical protein EYM84_05565 [Flavobacteriales bacterium]|nr:hypothetical protein [Flavobacteriales bacterium]HIN39721.1 hypothetical protein [Flavobacteriales bacterium]